MSRQVSKSLLSRYFLSATSQCSPLAYSELRWTAADAIEHGSLTKKPLGECRTSREKLSRSCLIESLHLTLFSLVKKLICQFYVLVLALFRSEHEPNRWFRKRLNQAGNCVFEKAAPLISFAALTGERDIKSRQTFGCWFLETLSRQNTLTAFYARYTHARKYVECR